MFPSSEYHSHYIPYMRCNRPSIRYCHTDPILLLQPLLHPLLLALSLNCRLYLLRLAIFLHSPLSSIILLWMGLSFCSCLSSIILLGMGLSFCSCLSTIFLSWHNHSILRFFLIIAVWHSHSILLSLLHPSPSGTFSLYSCLFPIHPILHNHSMLMSLPHPPHRTQSLYTHVSPSSTTSCTITLYSCLSSILPVWHIHCILLSLLNPSPSYTVTLYVLPSLFHPSHTTPHTTLFSPYQDGLGWLSPRTVVVIRLFSLHPLHVRTDRSWALCCQHFKNWGRSEETSSVNNTTVIRRRQGTVTDYLFYSFSLINK